MELTDEPNALDFIPIRKKTPVPTEKRRPQVCWKKRKIPAHACKWSLVQPTAIHSMALLQFISKDFVMYVHQISNKSFVEF